jgi:hypothetical protein
MYILLHLDRSARRLLPSAYAIFRKVALYNLAQLLGELHCRYFAKRKFSGRENHPSHSRPKVNKVLWVVAQSEILENNGWKRAHTTRQFNHCARNTRQFPKCPGNVAITIILRPSVRPALKHALIR